MLLRLTILVCFEILLLCQWVYSQECIDKASNCVLRKQLGLCSRTPLWQDCLKTCERCPSAGCADLWADCSQRKILNQCSALQMVCRKTCGYCATTAVTSRPTGCRDVRTDCLIRKQYQQCPHLRGNCDRTCGFCADEMPTAKWSKWSRFGKCSKKCGGGSQTRTRTCSVKGSCPGMSSNSRKCNQKACSGKSYSSWTKYGKCSVTCGSGTRSRTRKCLKGSCKLPLSQKKNCRGRKCPVEDCSDIGVHCTVWKLYNQCGSFGEQCRKTCDLCTDSKPGKWGKWSKYQPCSKSCGGGTAVRTRTCSKPGGCKGSDKQSKRCRTNRCKDATTGKWSNWSAYKACTKSCGGGTSTRHRTCSKPGKCKGTSKQSKPCGTHPCEGKWSNWSGYKACTKSCGGGTSTRHRTCSKPGKCKGTSKESKPCGTHPCEGEWKNWTTWSSCSNKCGSGKQERTRSCQGKGKCTGETKQSRVCNTKPCQSSLWLPWENWGGCNKPCGSGVRTRIRICSASSGCSGQSVETSPCQLRTCSSEISYSPCSRTCGDGIQKKLESSGEYSTRHCKLRSCPNVFCPHNHKERYKNPDNSCCLKASSSSCGISSSTSHQYERRVIGGTNSAKGEWPWMVYLTGPFGHCGGALLSSKYILTAAHCLQTDGGTKHDVNSFTVVIGFADLRNRQGKSYALARSVVYPLYSFPKHDIGILELKSAIAFNDYIRPICLPHGEEPPYDSTCITMGWGVSVNGLNQITQILQNADIRVFDPDVCVHGYNNPSLAEYLPFLKARRGYVCSGDLVNAKDSCSGDSGSPLVCQRCKNCGWYVAGLSSFGPTPCATKGIPAVYTKITDYEEWIYHVTGISKQSWTC